MGRFITTLTVFAAAASVAAALTCQCSANAGGKCNLDKWVDYRACWESTDPHVNQDCTRICPTWTKGIDWATKANTKPYETQSTQSTRSWSAVDASTGGALEFLTGDGTHCTMVFFNGISFEDDRRLAEKVVDGAMDFMKASNVTSVPVRESLTYMWGCGDACIGATESALVDVDSPLAKMKYALMDHFDQQGYQVDRRAWGATAHVKIIV
eukprot:TRINITY_DN7935_c0_g1_i1.p4 TRINITY_DN7935_c0_g1~~TRINITY_DN7935_c0_g1_i1.p4  ORF type:complete len:211 (+),score=81.82 TRINITY_DN7935_c0_g1_i1:91-723(+)